MTKGGFSWRIPIIFGLLILLLVLSRIFADHLQVSDNDLSRSGSQGNGEQSVPGPGPNNGGLFSGLGLTTHKQKKSGHSHRAAQEVTNPNDLDGTSSLFNNYYSTQLFGLSGTPDYHSQSSLSLLNNSKNNSAQPIASRIEQSLTLGDKSYHQNTGTETGFLLPLYQNPEVGRLLYMNFKLGLDNSAWQRAGAGLGFRKLLINTTFLNQKQWILGINGEVRGNKGQNKWGWWQENLGIEALSSDYDFRGNFYWPHARQKKIVINSRTYEGRQGYFWQEDYFHDISALGGADFELGYKLPFFRPEAKLYLGGYFYQKLKYYRTVLHHSRAIGEWEILKESYYKRVSGKKARLELRFGHDNIRAINPNLNFMLGGEYRYDNYHHRQFYLLAKISYQFGTDHISHQKNSAIQSDLRLRMNELPLKDRIFIQKNAVYTKRNIGYKGWWCDNDSPIQDIPANWDGNAESLPGGANPECQS